MASNIDVAVEGNAGLSFLSHSEPNSGITPGMQMLWLSISSAPVMPLSRKPLEFLE